MDRERLIDNKPITWQGDRGVTLRVRYEVTGTGGVSALIAREFHIRFGEPCPVLAAIAGESPATMRNLITTLRDYSRRHPLNGRQGITMDWIRRELKRSIIDSGNDERR